MATFLSCTQSTEWSGTTPPTTAIVPGGTPAGVWVAFPNSGSAHTPNAITAVTYGGVALTYGGVMPTDTAGEQGSASWWFLGSGVPTGNQNVAVTQSGGNGQTRRYYVYVLAGTDDLEVIDHAEISEDGVDPTFTFNSGSRSSIILAAGFSGRPTGNVAPGTGITVDFETGVASDARSFHAGHETTPTTGSRSIAWSIPGSDDQAFVGVLIGEVIPVVDIDLEPDPVSTGTLAPSYALEQAFEIDTVDAATDVPDPTIEHELDILVDTSLPSSPLWVSTSVPTISIERTGGPVLPDPVGIIRAGKRPRTSVFVPGETIRA